MESDAIIQILSRVVPPSGIEAVAAGDGMPTLYVRARAADRHLPRAA